MNTELCEPVQMDLVDQQPIALPSFASSSVSKDMNRAGTSGEGSSTVAAWLGDASQHGPAFNPLEEALACPDPGMVPKAGAARWGSIPNADDVPAISIGGQAMHQDAHTNLATPTAGSIAIPETLASMRWINKQPTLENSHSCDETPANASAAPPEPPPPTLHRFDQSAGNANEDNAELVAEQPPFMQRGISDQSDGEESIEVPLPHGPTSVPAAWLAAAATPPLPQTRLGGVATTSPSTVPPPPGLQPRPQAVSASSQDVDSNAGLGDDTKTDSRPSTALAVGHRSSALTTQPVVLITADGSDDMEPVHCKVADLWEWLTQVKLEEYYVAATRWCADMGAVSMEEIAENIVDFSDAVELKPIERQRVQKWSAQVLWNSESVPLVQPSLQLEDVTPPLREPAAPSRNSVSSMSDEDDTGSASKNPVYTAQTVRLAMDSSGSTGLDLQWNEEWGILVHGVDPLPGQPGLRAGDYIVAIDGCSLRNRSHEDCDAAFSGRLQNGAVLSIVSPVQSVSQSRPATRTRGQTSQVRQLPRHAAWQTSRDPLPGKGRRGGYDANRMWTRFRGPPW
mmetsp:Transcript_80188/g.155009  ORF Transcript_80188/g.155009 Transcript_80188/m.155009 type:complete len:568 (+) Transcript_80188:107-1810(+)